MLLEKTDKQRSFILPQYHKHKNPATLKKTNKKTNPTSTALNPRFVDTEAHLMINSLEDSAGLQWPRFVAESWHTVICDQR